jgi:hypothetical protein
MSSSLSQAQQDELKFVKNHLDKLSQHPVKYANDFSTPDENKPRKPPMVGVSGSCHCTSGERLAK